jgi:hypothetical protein
MHVAQGLGPVRVLAKNQMPWDGSIDSCPPPTFSTRRYRQEAGESLLRAHSSEMKAECSVYDYDGDASARAAKGNLGLVYTVRFYICGGD